MALPAFEWDHTTQCCRAFTLALARLSCKNPRWRTATILKTKNCTMNLSTVTNDIITSVTFLPLPGEVESILRLLPVCLQFLYLLNFCPLFCCCTNRVWRQIVSLNLNVRVGTRIFRAISGEFSKQFLLLFSRFSPVQISVQDGVDGSEFLEDREPEARNPRVHGWMTLTKIMVQFASIV